MVFNIEYKELSTEPGRDQHISPGPLPRVVPVAQGQLVGQICDTTNGHGFPCLSDLPTLTVSTGFRAFDPMRTSVPQSHVMFRGSVQTHAHTQHTYSCAGRLSTVRAHAVMEVPNTLK